MDGRSRRAGAFAALALVAGSAVAIGSPTEHLGATVRLQTAQGEKRSFTIDRHLESGGWSHAYVGREAPNGRAVAIKILRTSIHDNGGTDAFDWETEVSRRVPHPTLLVVHGVATTEAGRRALVSELVPGMPLGLHFRPMAPRTVRRAVRIALDLLGGVEALERADLRHNDIVPGNVIEDTDGAVKLIDFGNTRRPGVPTHRLRFYRPDEVGSANIDVYSMGALLIHLLTGQASRDALGELSDPALRNVLARATDPDPALRYQRAQDLVQALVPFATR
jgi:serine/threonine-protein kinase